MRVYIDTGILIDYIAQVPFTALRSTQRRGRSPQQLYEHAREILELVSASHEGAISTLSFYEVEEALYALVSTAIKGVPSVQAKRVAATRPILVQALYAVRLFGLEILSLTEGVIDAVAGSATLPGRGMRIADGLHLAMAAGC